MVADGDGDAAADDEVEAVLPDVVQGGRWVHSLKRTPNFDFISIGMSQYVPGFRVREERSCVISATWPFSDSKNKYGSAIKGLLFVTLQTDRNLYYTLL